jgi:hypothetical protein
MSNKRTLVQRAEHLELDLQEFVQKAHFDHQKLRTSVSLGKETPAQQVILIHQAQMRILLAGTVYEECGPIATLSSMGHGLQIPGIQSLLSSIQIPSQRFRLLQLFMSSYTYRAADFALEEERCHLPRRATHPEEHQAFQKKSETLPVYLLQKYTD